MGYSKEYIKSNFLDVFNQSTVSSLTMNTDGEDKQVGLFDSERKTIKERFVDGECVSGKFSVVVSTSCDSSTYKAMLSGTFSFDSKNIDIVFGSEKIKALIVGEGTQDLFSIKNIFDLKTIKDVVEQHILMRFV